MALSLNRATKVTLTHFMCTGELFEKCLVYSTKIKLVFGMRKGKKFLKPVD